MLIPADKIKPNFCRDCGTKLNIKYLQHEVTCICGAIYKWSWDETGKNGGIWKQYHVLPLFNMITNRRYEHPLYLKGK